MKSSRHIFCLAIALALGVLLAPAPAASATTTTNQIAAKAKSGTNSVPSTNAEPTEIVIPLSVFELAAKPTKDPFFPLSTRQPVPVIANTNAQTISLSSFTLKGLSGSNNRRLALINNRTVAEGETAEVTTSAGKAKIRCVDIKESSVVIHVDSQSEPMEIFLRKAAQ